MNEIVSRVARAGDLSVAYSETNAGPCRATETLLLVHGNWSSRAWWEPVMRELPVHVRAIAPDLRGRGDTEGPDNGYAIADLARDILALADTLGLATFHIAGHSLGSAVALECALMEPARVRTLTVVATAWVDGMPAIFNQPHQQRALLDRAVLDRALRPLAPSARHDDPSWERCVSEGHRQRLAAALANLDALVAWSPGDRLRSLPMPRVVVTGADDILTGGRTAARAARALGTDLVVLPGVGHCPPIEAPERCATEILRLVERRATASVEAAG